MSLYSEWQALCKREMEDSELKEFWDTYFEAEKQNYIKILKDPEKVVEVAAKVSGDGTAKGEAAKHASEIEKFRCKKCGYVCATEKGMKMHFTKAHKGE